MPGWVGEDPRRGELARQSSCAQGQDLRLGGGEVIDHDVEVELLGPGGIAPFGWLMVGRELERDPGGRVWTCWPQRSR